ncbi:MAG: Rne/Rng family ribonuclease [Mariprofundaceae bacterium]
MSTIKKVMLINASHDEESRVAIVVNDYLQELDIESAHKALTKGNIYKGTVTKVEASLQAAFIEYGSARQGFLPLNEIHPDCWKEGADKSADPRKVNIRDVLENKQELLIQVVKEERGNKGAALTTNISLAGRYTVLMPNNSRGGISRKLSDDERRTIKQILTQLNVPDNMGLIVRTAGKDQELESLEWDYQYLRRLWDEIRIKGDSAPSPSLIYLEGDLATRAIRDHFTDDIDEIWVDNHEVYTRTKSFVHAVLPGKEKMVKLYRGKKPLFRQYKIEMQCEEIHEREIRLRSGGSIVFDPTEALTSIDVNSSRATAGKHIDDTALTTNLEAAEEIARQLRIRDIGGLVVIDFIDMANRKHGQQVEEVLRDATHPDKARIQLAKISRFGLLEMSRQRLHPSVRESTTETCPRCQGRGSIRTLESMALQMLTRMEDWAEMGKKPTLVVQVPSGTGEYLMNNKRDHIARIEENYEVQISLQIKPEMVIPHYRIERQWNENNQQRIEVLEDTGKSRKPARPNRKLNPMKPVVGVPTPQQAPQKASSKKESWLASLWELLTGQEKKKKKLEEEERAKRQTPRRGRNPKRNNNRKRKPNTSKEISTVTDSKSESKKESKPASKQEAKSTKAQPVKATDTESSEGQQRKRRRRRRRPAGKAEGQDNNTQVTTVDQPTKTASPKAEVNTQAKPEVQNKQQSTPKPATPTASEKKTAAPEKKAESPKE